jgi:sec-independent protein translocase protein TatB
MFDMSWGEVMVIGAVALVVIGPKDLPKALRTVGQMTTKVRRMAAEFQSQFNEAMREAELDEVKRQIQDVNDSVSSLNTQTFNPVESVRDELKGAIEAPVGPAPDAASDAIAELTPPPAVAEPYDAMPPLAEPPAPEPVPEGAAPSAPPQEKA